MDNEKIETSEAIPENIQEPVPNQESVPTPLKEAPSVLKKPRARRKTKKIAEPAISAAPAVSSVPEENVSSAKTGIIIGAVVFLIAAFVIGGSVYAYLKVKKTYITPFANQLKNLSNPPSPGMTEISETGSDVNNDNGAAPVSPEEQIFGQVGTTGKESENIAEEDPQSSEGTIGTISEIEETIENDEENAEEDTEDTMDTESDNDTQPEPVVPYDFDSKISEMDSKMRSLNYENFDSALINDSEVGL